MSNNIAQGRPASCCVPTGLALAVLFAAAPKATATAMAEQPSPPGANLPENIRAKVFEKLGFEKPIERTFRTQHLFASGGGTFFASLAEGDDSGLWQAKLLLPKGYLLKRGQTKTDRGQFDWGEFGEAIAGGVRDLEPTPKFRPYLSIGRDGTATVQLAKRVLDSMDYSNRWQLNGLDTWSFTFSYHIEPVLPDLPRLGPFKGKGSAQVNPATGEYDAVTAADVGERFGSALADKGADEYVKWLASLGASSQADPSTGTGATRSPGQPTGEVSVDCANFDSCLRQGLAARDGDDWPKALALLSRATSLSEGNPRAWYALGEAHLATRDYAKASAAWDRVLALGSPLELASCLSGLACKVGRLSLSSSSVSFTSEKNESAFNAAPTEFLVNGPKRAKVMFSSSTAIWLELEAKAKKWKVSFLPPGVQGCEKSASYLCPDPGPNIQEAVAAYVKDRIGMLARGETPKLPPVTTAPPDKRLQFTSPVGSTDATQSQLFGAPSSEGRHTGVDFSATRERAPAHAIADGVVAEVVSNGKGCSGGNGPGYACEDHGLGNVVIIEHSIVSNDTKHIFSLYGHLDSIAPGLEKGSKVAGGEVIGAIGASGYGLAQYWRRPASNGLCGPFPKGAPCVHLHLEIKDSPILHNPLGGDACKGPKGAAPCWGYVPGDPQQFGYRDPATYLPVDGR